MPLTLNQLKAKLRQNPEQFKENQKKLMNFSKTLYKAHLALARGDKVDRQLSNRVSEFSEAFETLSRDLTNPRNQKKLEDALTTLADFGDFLGRRDEPFSTTNVCMRIMELPGVADHAEIENGLKTFNEVFGFGVNVESLTSGTVDEPTEEEKQNRSVRRNAWKAQRELEQLENQREQELAEARKRARQEAENKRLAEEAAQRKREQEQQEEEARLEELGRKVLEEEERERKRKEAREQKEKEERIRQEEARIAQENEAPAREENAVPQEQSDMDRILRENQRQVDQQIRQAQQRAYEDAARRAAARATNQNLRAQLRTAMDTSLSAARNPQASAQDRKYNLALALAIHRELRDVPADDSVPISTDDVNETTQRLYESAAFTIAERQGKLNELAAEPLDSLDQQVRTTQQGVDASATAAEFGLRMNPDLQNAPNAEAEGVAYTRGRAKQILAQMNAAWRFLGNSAQFDALKQAVQDVGDKNPPTQVDHYLAGETAKAYVAKNLQKAESAAGMTRMACAMAFLKQTMSKESFAAYCSALNAQRRIKQVPPNSLNFDKTEPRCFVPDEIGTVREVYNTVRERFFHLYDEETGYKAPDPRDLAMLTALKNLQAKAGGNENLVVEHEALQKEIEKVQADRRFQDALKNHSAHELIEMAGGHNLDTISGYAEDLKPDQRARVQQELDRLSEKEAARLAKEEEARKAKEAAERRAKEEADRLKAERQRQEQERLKREAEERDFQKFRETNKNADELLMTLYPTFDKVAKPDAINRAMDNFNLDPLEEYVEFAAKLKAINELGKAAAAEKMADTNDRRKGYINLDTLNQRVEALKGDPMIRQIAEDLRDGENVPAGIEKDRQEGEKQNYDGKIYSLVKLCHRVQNLYVSKHEALADEILPSRWPTVGQAYREFIPDVDALNMGAIGGYKMAGVLAAKMVALREIEEKGARGLDTPVNVKQWKKRAMELYHDKLFDTIGQNLLGLKGQKDLARAFNMTLNREQTFAEHVTKMYKELKLAKQNGQAPKEQQNPEVQQPKEPEVKVNGNNAGPQINL